MQPALHPDRAAGYLADHGIVPAAASVTVEALGGGVSNRVLAVTWDEDCLVAKQPLPNLDVAEDWPADVNRVHTEASAIEAYERILDEASNSSADPRDAIARVPSIRFEDPDEHVIAVDCAPAEARMWKTELLAGRTDDRVADALGTALGLVHETAAGDDQLRRSFDDSTPFEQLRIDPYHRHTAEAHPDVADRILEEAERTSGVRRTLVHGDYSPKNVLVDRHAEQLVPWLIDFEVAHWGDPAFDVAFLLNHLFIKSVYVPSTDHGCHDAGPYIGCAHRVWECYDEQVSWEIEADVVRELAVLMLARVDGKSPVEYVTRDATKDRLRKIAKTALRQETETIGDFTDLVRTIHATDP